MRWLKRQWHRAWTEDEFWRPFAIAGAIILALILLSGCASTFGQPYVTPPGNFACSRVMWTEESKIGEHCAPGAGSCGTVSKDLNTIWTPKPAAFDDFWRVYRLGHEFLHNLGATHQ